MGTVVRPDQVRRIPRTTVVRPDRVQRVPRSTTRKTIDVEGAEYSGLPEQIAEFRSRGGTPEAAGLSLMQRRKGIGERAAETAIRAGGQGVGILTGFATLGPLGIIPGAAAGGAGSEALLESIGTDPATRDYGAAARRGAIEGGKTGAIATGAGTVAGLARMAVPARGLLPTAASLTGEVAGAVGTGKLVGEDISPAEALVMGAGSRALGPTGSLVRAREGTQRYRAGELLKKPRELDLLQKELSRARRITIGKKVGVEEAQRGLAPRLESVTEAKRKLARIEADVKQSRTVGRVPEGLARQRLEAQAEVARTRSESMNRIEAGRLRGARAELGRAEAAETPIRQKLAEKLPSALEDILDPTRPGLPRTARLALSIANSVGALRLAHGLGRVIQTDPAGRTGRLLSGVVRELGRNETTARAMLARAMQDNPDLAEQVTNALK